MSAVAVTDAAISGPHGAIPVRRYVPSEPLAGPTIVWVHGGAFVSGGLDQPESHAVAGELAARGFRVVTVAYRLATLPGRRPMVRFPVPLDDVVAVVAAVRNESSDGVILGGASAGACLSAAAVLRFDAHERDFLRGLVLAYGTFHANLPAVSPELRSRLRGYRRFTHTAAAIRRMNLNYAGSVAALSNPFAFPGGHALAGLPRTLLLNADHDVLRASGEQFARELDAAGIPTEHHLVENAAHAFLNRPTDPGFATGIELITSWATTPRPPVRLPT